MGSCGAAFCVTQLRHTKGALLEFWLHLYSVLDSVKKMCKHYMTSFLYLCRKPQYFELGVQIQSNYFHIVQSKLI